MSDSLALGQRLGSEIQNTGFTPEEMSYLAQQSVTQAQVIVQFSLDNTQTLTDAIGAIELLQKGQGQPRTEPLDESIAQSNAEVDSKVQAEGLGNTESQADLEVTDKAISEGLIPPSQTNE